MPSTVILKKSNTLNKLPSAGDLQYGELAINYAKDGEMLILKNDQNEIVGFSSDVKINAVLEIISQAIATLQRDMADTSAVEAETERATSAETALMNELQELIDDYNEKCEVISQTLAELDRDKADSSALTAAVEVETQRATSAETVLNSSVSALTTNLSDLVVEINEKLEVASQAIALINDKLSDMEISGVSGGNYTGSN